MRAPSRRTAIAAGLVASAVVAGGVVAAVRGPSPTSTLTSLSDVPPPGDDAYVSQTLTPTPTESPSATPTPTPTQSARPKPTSTLPPDEQASRDLDTGDNLGPHPPGSVDFPYEPGRTTWDATSNGIHIHVALSPAKPKVGSAVTWTVTATSNDGACCAAAMVFGDGRSSPQMDCDKPEGSFAWPHTYNKSGRLHFLVQATSNQCRRGGSIYGTIDVAPGTRTAQGPSLPAVKLDTSTRPAGHEDDFHWVSLWGEAEDPDGYIGKLVVTWGDGTSTTFKGDEAACRAGYDGWPVSSYAHLPFQPPPAHRYTSSGEYTITLTAYSSGCNGSMVQTGKASFVWPVGEPEPTATPSATPSA